MSLIVMGRTLKTLIPE